MNWDDSCCTLELRLKAAASHKEDHFSDGAFLKLIKDQHSSFRGTHVGEKHLQGMKKKVDFSTETDSAVRKACGFIPEKLYFPRCII